MSPSIRRIPFGGEEAIGEHPTGSGGTAWVIWLPVPGKEQTHVHVIVWTADDVLTTPDVVRASAGPPSQKLLDQI